MTSTATLLTTHEVLAYDNIDMYIPAKYLFAGYYYSGAQSDNNKDVYRYRSVTGEIRNQRDPGDTDRNFC